MLENHPAKFKLFQTYKIMIQEVQVLTSSQNTTSTQIWIVYWIWEAQHVEKLKGNSYVLSFYRSLQDIYDSRN